MTALSRPCPGVLPALAGCHSATGPMPPKRDGRLNRPLVIERELSLFRILLNAKCPLSVPTCATGKKTLSSQHCDWPVCQARPVPSLQFCIDNAALCTWLHVSLEICVAEVVYFRLEAPVHVQRASSGILWPRRFEDFKMMLEGGKGLGARINI